MFRFGFCFSSVHCRVIVSPKTSLIFLSLSVALSSFVGYLHYHLSILFEIIFIVVYIFAFSGRFTFQFHSVIEDFCNKRTAAQFFSLLTRFWFNFIRTRLVIIFPLNLCAFDELCSCARVSTKQRLVFPLALVWHAVDVAYNTAAVAAFRT